jgi:ATP-dependent helicase HrpA
MAANGVADRIRDELQGSFGGEEGARELVSVQTSEKYERSEHTKIFVRTDGLEQVIQLEERLGRMSPERADEEAAQTVLILDEVHESNPNLVGLLAIMKRVIAKYPSMRLVVMSATVNAKRYSDYFADVSPTGEVPVVTIEGRTHEVVMEEHPELMVDKALDRILHTAKDIKEGDDILIFMPGKVEIQDIIEACKERLEHYDGIVNFLPLHARMTEQEQSKVLPDHEGINVIVATDVAMTSLTFPRVKYILDTGLTKNPHLDEEGASGLVLETARGQSACSVPVVLDGYSLERTGY